MLLKYGEINGNTGVNNGTQGVVKIFGFPEYFTTWKSPKIL